MPTVVMTPAEVVRAAERRHASSPAAATALQQVSDPDVRLVDLSATVQQDPALAARLLRQANSPLFGLRRQVGDLSTAVRVLGLRGTREAVLAAVLHAMAQDVGPCGKEVFERSCGAARVGHQLAAAIPGVTPGELATAALLQDLGVLLLLLADPEQAGRMERAGAHEALAEEEREALGFTHADVGGCLMLRWGMPGTLVRTVESHHRAEASERLAAALRLTNRVHTLLDHDDAMESLEAEGLLEVSISARLPPIIEELRATPAS